ncbi:bifunctional ADP-dependent NAD(P)H-hydrate dehydratase/NAD(P)H-hydrate epimerase [Lentibacillus jeotgali]|uniref:bifunctional ADP-dependent NAD(P)H-hydrate dehydratase/NAD(P)H-hydrate epimerase n=1 Tax=Lentibacillus jeotgali TaxID=558169 RepID=UPI0002627FE7|nr:bifunctional ADP-dependent NAD(P)H-hydrate dehydratase/NAD(P)H-hydrate epimerase [Lentibacillus jeotgali]
MYIVTAEEMYDMDHGAIHDIGIDGRMLMENAGRAMADRIETRIGKTDRIRILAGSGSNGGYGFVIARTLLNKGYEAVVVQVVPNEKVTGDALLHKNLFIRCGGNVRVTRQPSEIEVILKEADVIIDAILGIGTKGMLREPLDEIVPIMNELAAYIISADIPSGLPADEGMEDFQAVQADETVVAEYPKMSVFLESTSAYYGEWSAVSIGLPKHMPANQVQRRIWMPEDFQATMPERKCNAHKGNHGRGLVIGGSAEMPGSIAMTSNAALRTGAGLMTVATPKNVIPVVASHCMEATYLTLEDTGGFLNGQTAIPFDHFDATVLGMGMGRHEEAGELTEQAVETQCPLIVDADGLHHLKPLLERLKDRSGPVVLTPHPGEMAMLLDTSVPELLKTPFAYTKMFAEKYQVYVVLKGMSTIITTPEGMQTVSTAGNQGLAKGGSGDVLSGIMLAMIMQPQTVSDALCNACFVHGKAAELLTEESHSAYDLMASDVIRGITDVYRTFLTLP